MKKYISTAVFLGCFCFTADVLAYCGITFAYDQILSVPQSFCVYGPYNQGAVICQVDSPNTAAGCMHVYWNTSNHSIQTFTYTPGTHEIHFDIGYSTSQPWVSAAPFAQSPQGTYLSQYYSSPSSRKTMPSNTDWAFACSHIQVSDPSIVMTNAVTNETCSGPLPPTPLGFPLDKDCNGVACTPYTAEVSSVMDHSMTSPYVKDGVTRAFSGEEGHVDNGCWCYSTNSSCDSGNYTSCAVVGFEKSGGESFLEDSNGNKAINYPGGSYGHNDTFLFYDGHPGYDYPASPSTDIIVSPANGTLCVATSATQQPYPIDVWRENTHCPYATEGGTTWADSGLTAYHTFYIIHKGLYINGSTNDYMTVFLHSDDLESSIRADIEQNGYAQVTKGEHIAQVGDVGASGAYHMHLEVYKKNGTNWDRVDPYGDGTNNILWEHN